MNKIDLIIDRLELAQKFDWNTFVLKGSIHDALAAARELKALQPVAWKKKDGSSIEVSIMSAEYMEAEGFVPLYRLDEVTK